MGQFVERLAILVAAAQQGQVCNRVSAAVFVEIGIILLQPTPLGLAFWGIRG